LISRQSGIIRREKQREICREASRRITKEWNNFEHIVAGKGYRSDVHRKAVEQSSFDLLLVSMEKLEKLRKFSKAAKLVASHCKMRDAAMPPEYWKKLTSWNRS